MKRGILLLMVVAAGVAWFLALPPRARTLAVDGSVAPRPVRGVFHVHTDRSDGTGSVEDVAAAAARAGLRFVVLTDHGDATRAPLRPRYVQDVLVVDAVEISTSGGHLVALGMPAAPYPLGGEARDVVDDVERLGGMAIAAHPGSERAELRWTAWDAPIDGLEWLNADSEWRDESAWTLARALVTYPGRRPESIAAMLDRPEAPLRRWDALTRRRRVVGVLGADAHARIGLRTLGEPYDNTARLHVPSYEQTFRAFSIVLPDLVLSGRDAEADTDAVVSAIRGGRVYSVIDAVASPGSMSFTARGPSGPVAAGEAVPITSPVPLRVDVRGAPDARIELLKNGTTVAEGQGGALDHLTDEPGVYRAEVYLAGAPGTPPVPWIVSNPIYVGVNLTDTPAVAPRARPSDTALLYENGPARDWRIENSPQAQGALDVVPGVAGGTQILMRYAIGGAASASPYAALVMPAGPELSRYDRLMFTARADRAMRVSIQLRVPGGTLGERWQRSVYVDTEERALTVYFDDLTPVGVTSQRRPRLAAVDSILFVVDRVNTALGTGGQIWIDSVRYGR